MPAAFRLFAAVSCAGFLAACQPAAETADLGPGSPLDQAITLLQVQSRSADPAVRANCIEALQPSTDPRAVEVIEQGLHDPEWVVRFASAMAIGKRRDGNYRSTLQTLVTSDPNESVKAAAVYALRRLGDTDNMNVLASTLHSKDPAARANTALVLGLMGDRSAVTLLESMRTETEAPVNFEITAALARLGDPGAKNVIISYAFSKYAEDQYSAMMVCADLPEEAATPLLVGLKDMPANVPLGERTVTRELTTRRQLVAARALGKRNTIQGLDIAEANLKNSDPSLRALAAMAVAEMIHGTGVRLVVPLLKDPDPRVQRAAAQAVVNIACRKPGSES